MSRQADFVLLSILVLASSALVHGQEGHPTPANGLANQKTLIVGTETKSDSVVAVPPITSVSVNLRAEKKLSADAIDLLSWIAKEAALNGLQSTDLRPWHIAISYDQFDEDGDNVHSGVYEEYWAGTNKYKQIYKSDNFNQTDYATDKGLYRVGDQAWPDRVHERAVDLFPVQTGRRELLLGWTSARRASCEPQRRQFLDVDPARFLRRQTSSHGPCSHGPLRRPLGFEGPFADEERNAVARGL